MIKLAPATRKINTGSALVPLLSQKREGVRFFICSCPDSTWWGAPCRHIFAVAMMSHTIPWLWNYHNSWIREELLLPTHQLATQSKPLAFHEAARNNIRLSFTGVRIAGAASAPLAVTSRDSVTMISSVLSQSIDWHILPQLQLPPKTRHVVAVRSKKSNQKSNKRKNKKRSNADDFDFVIR